MNGARMNGLITLGGDSGSPIYRIAGDLYAIGVLDMLQGHFARVHNALTNWDWKMYTVD